MGSFKRKILIYVLTSFCLLTSFFGVGISLISNFVPTEQAQELDGTYSVDEDGNLIRANADTSSDMPNGGEVVLPDKWDTMAETDVTNLTSNSAYGGAFDFNNQTINLSSSSSVGTSYFTSTLSNTVLVVKNATISGASKYLFSSVGSTTSETRIVFYNCSFSGFNFSYLARSKTGAYTFSFVDCNLNMITGTLFYGSPATFQFLNCTSISFSASPLIVSAETNHAELNLIFENCDVSLEGADLGTVSSTYNLTTNIVFNNCYNPCINGAVFTGDADTNIYYVDCYLDPAQTDRGNIYYGLTNDGPGYLNLVFDGCYFGPQDVSMVMDTCSNYRYPELGVPYFDQIYASSDTDYGVVLKNCYFELGSRVYGEEPYGVIFAGYGFNNENEMDFLPGYANTEIYNTIFDGSEFYLFGSTVDSENNVHIFNDVLFMGGSNGGDVYYEKIDTGEDQGLVWGDMVSIDAKYVKTDSPTFAGDGYGSSYGQSFVTMYNADNTNEPIDIYDYESEIFQYFDPNMFEPITELMKDIRL